MDIMVHLLWSMNVDSWTGVRTFLGVFGSEEEARDEVKRDHAYWRNNPDASLEPYFKVESKILVDVKPMN